MQPKNDIISRLSDQVCWQIRSARINFITIQPFVIILQMTKISSRKYRNMSQITKLSTEQFHWSQGRFNESYFHIYVEAVFICQYFLKFINYSFRILFALFAGTWSDRRGRKGLMFLSIFGWLLKMLSFLVNYWFMNTLDWRFLYLEFVDDLCGSSTTYYMMQYSYMVDVTTIAERTFRMAILEGTDYGSTSLGNGISGPLFAELGYYGVFGISLGCNLVSLFYILFYLKESVVVGVGDEKNSKNQNGQSNQICSIFKASLLYTLDGFRSVLQKRDGWRRFFVFLGIFNYATGIFAYIGKEGSHRFYFMENKYSWTEENSTTLLFVQKLSNWFALWMIVPVLKNVLKVHDNVIAVISLTLATIGIIHTACL